MRQTESSSFKITQETLKVSGREVIFLQVAPKDTEPVGTPIVWHQGLGDNLKKIRTDLLTMADVTASAGQAREFIGFVPGKRKLGWRRNLEKIKVPGGTVRASRESLSRADDIVKILKEKKIKQAHLAGLSAGGMVVTLAAHQAHTEGDNPFDMVVPIHSGGMDNKGIVRTTGRVILGGAKDTIKGLFEKKQDSPEQEEIALDQPSRRDQLTRLVSTIIATGRSRRLYLLLPEVKDAVNLQVINGAGDWTFPRGPLKKRLEKRGIPVADLGWKRHNMGRGEQRRERLTTIVNFILEKERK